MTIRIDGSNTTANPGITGADADTGLQFGTNEVKIVTGGSDRVTVDSAGRVGLGSSTPGTRLDVVGGAIRTDDIFTLYKNAADAFYIGAGTIITGGASTDIALRSNQNGSILFSTNGATERIRITSSGTIGINETAPLGKVHINGVGGFYNQCFWITGWGSGIGAAGVFKSSNTSNADVIYFSTPAATVGSISITASSTAYNTTSDYRLKENVVPLTGAIDRLNELQVHRFNFIADPDTTVDGFIAHEAQAVVPECVTGTKDEVDEKGDPKYQGIDQSKLVPLLTAALQEAVSRIETLEAQNAQFEARLTALEGGTN